jgi:integral membrane sensor domain MASE1
MRPDFSVWIKRPACAPKGGLMTEVVLSIAMLAVVALAVGGARLVATKQDRKRGLLMLAVAVVLLGNVLILAWPVGR